MYLCICNAIKEADVREAGRTGSAATASQYLRARGIAPKCGKCVREVHSILRNESGSLPGASVRLAAAR